MYCIVCNPNSKLRKMYTCHSFFLSYLCFWSWQNCHESCAGNLNFFYTFLYIINNCRFKKWTFYILLRCTINKKYRIYTFESICFYLPLPFQYLTLALSASVRGNEKEKKERKHKCNERCTVLFFRFSFLYHFKDYYSTDEDSKFELKRPSRLDIRWSFAICSCLYLTV